MPLDDYRTAFDHCTFCAKICRHTCPVGNAERREAVIPQAKMAMANLIRTGQVPLSAETASVFYACAACGLCGEYCEHEVDVTPALFAARSLAAEHGVEPASMKHYAERFHARSEALARDLHQRVPERYFVREAQVAYFPSCDVIEHRPGTIADTFKVLESVGIDYVAIHEGSYVCGGYPLWAAGLTSELSYVAREVAASLSRYKKIICDCPACIWVMRFLYPQLGAPIHAEVIHVVEFLDHFVSRIQPRRVEPTAFWHDPCYLGRWLGVFDAPRRLLGRAVHEIREFAWNRERGYCCGGGGLVPSTQRDVAVEIARRRMQDVHRTDVKLVVTACATCEWNLARAAGEGVEVVDLMTFLARSV